MVFKINKPNTKGVILAGGTGSRLYPLTKVLNKQLLPVYDKPMIYYSIAVHMLAGVREIALVTDERNVGRFQEILGNGSSIGISIHYIIQSEPLGLAHGLKLSMDFLDKSDVFFSLGDNILFGPDLSRRLNGVLNSDRSTIFGYRVKNPKDFGVIEIDSDGKPQKIIEKPSYTKSDLISIGFYFYRNQDLSHLVDLIPSERNELEITDFNQCLLEQKKLDIISLDRGFTWFDCGSHDNLQRAGNFVKTTQEIQGYLIACLEEIALTRGYITKGELKQGEAYNSSGAYANYVRSID